MTANTEQERPKREDFEQWSISTNQGYDLTRNQSGRMQTYEHDKTEHAWRGFCHGWIAARRAPVVPPDQLPQDAAKHAMEKLQAAVEKLRSALAECRDACPIPKPGASNEEAWMQSVGDPESVPAFVKSCLQAPVVPQGWKLVPEWPTVKMSVAGDDVYREDGPGVFSSNTIYKRMLSAAPQPPEAQRSENLTIKTEAAPVQLPDELLTLETDAHYIFNNPPGECPQVVCDVIEWYAASVRQLLAQHGIK